MSNPEITSKKRKELENGDEENSKKSKIECSDTQPDSPPGQDHIEQNLKLFIAINPLYLDFVDFFGLFRIFVG